MNLVDLRKEPYSDSGIDYQYGKLHIVGLGLERESSLSLKVKTILQNANVICCLESKEKFLESYGNVVDAKNILSFDFMFWTLSSRSDALLTISKKIHSLALSLPGVVFALAGHPNCAVTPTSYLIKLAKNGSINIDLIPSLSSIDYFMADCSIDLISRGVQIVKGVDVSKISDRLPYLILCPGYSDLTDMSKKEGSLNEMKCLLKKKYPDSYVYIYKKLYDGFILNKVLVDDLVEAVKESKLGETMLYGPA